MGDRANIYVHHGKSAGVYLYTHHDGTELPETVRQGLARKARWDDEQYLARILFDEMTGRRGGETGYGISAVVGDGDDRIVDVDTRAQTVTLTRYGATTDPIPFSRYITVEDLTWEPTDEQAAEIPA